MGGDSVCDASAAIPSGFGSAYNHLKLVIHILKSQFANNTAKPKIIKPKIDVILKQILQKIQYDRKY